MSASTKSWIVFLMCFRRAGLVAIDVNNHQSLILEFVLEVNEVRNLRPARGTPGPPEVNDGDLPPPSRLV